MDLNELTVGDVANLIKAFKAFLDHPSFNVPLFGKYKRSETVFDQVNGIEYTLHVYRGSLENKYSIHLRFLNNNTHLVRLCVNGARHHNNDGTMISGDHLHVYKFDPETEIVEAYAYELDKTPFESSDVLEESLAKFLAYANIHRQERSEAHA